MTANFW